MLHKDYRLNTGFDDVYEHGFKARGEYGMLIALEDTKMQNALFGVVVPKKVGKANKRNKLKRRIRFLVQRLINEGKFEKFRLKIMYVSFNAPQEFKDLEKEFLGQMDKVFENFRK